MKRRVRRLMFGILSGFFFLSCNEGPDVPNELDQWIKDVQAIDNYLTSTGVTAVEDPSGIRMVITSLGDGLPALPSNGVDVDYIGRRFDDKFVFQQGTARNKLETFIRGWQEALIKLPVGSEATIYIPSLLGYGTGGNGPNIPPNTIIEFDILFNEVVLTTAEVDRLEDDTSAIDQYLADRSIDAVKDPTGLRYVITQLGAGPSPDWYDQVEFKAVFKLLSNDSEEVASLTFAPSDNNFNRVIDQRPHGLKTGLQKLPEGSKATLYIPSGLAYGPEGATNGSVEVIPANANIIVEIELIDIK